MRIHGSTVVGLTLVLSAMACGRGDRTEGAAAPADTIPAYNPDTLAWVKQDRPVVFDDRGWLRTGETVDHPEVVRVGQFEGMDLYAPANEPLPYQHLLIPVGDGHWQMLEPIARVPKPGVDTMSKTPEKMERNATHPPMIKHH